MQFGYVSPEQIMKDRADYARKGISRGRSVVVIQYAGGILFAAESPSPSLHKISEIYDRIAFAAVGKYNEFENLRQAGVRLADLRGYSFDRVDVSGRALANVYAQTLGTIFTQEPKPYEVELVVAEVGKTADEDQIYRITYDGSVAAENGYAVMGGAAEQVARYVGDNVSPGGSLEDTLRLAVDALRRGEDGNDRHLPTASLEVAVLDRERPRRAFRRIVSPTLDSLLDRSGSEAGTDDSGD
ncbi:proteasome alpha subunit [Haloactinopolyspora alba]|uniref:Proteasome subunit alpha n=2 Tax=Haloactinopolyspora alba TaxID=648780 RepID=A0A2P8D9F4_9ACTN|nr:proteasome subunit alpha [Haloactinopolyspora alba]PSK93849.1 proteasome alpha subunit [Haloactinopolyspora alba]